MGSAPELLEIHSSFLVQLAWANLRSPEGLDRLLAAYIDELRLAVVRQQEKCWAENPRQGLGKIATDEGWDR